MSAPPPPPPPPPPPAAIKAPIPSTNKALLSSIEKGTKLKKVPESEKNDRSVVSTSITSSKSEPQTRPMNGVQSSAKSFPNIQSELTNHIMSRTTSNSRKISNPVMNNAPINRGAVKSNAPAANQFMSVNNKPPPPPPMNKKPSLVGRNTTEPIRPMSQMQDKPDRVMQTAPLIRKNQAPPSAQMANSSSGHVTLRPVFPVSRVTSNPPPPLPSMMTRDAPPPMRVQQPLASAPPVPSRAMSIGTHYPGPHQQHQQHQQQQKQQLPSHIPSSNGGNNRPHSYANADSANVTASSQYRVLDRPPPPPPPAAYSITTPPNQQGTHSPFDRRFKFPDERTFPSLKQQNVTGGSRLSLSSSSSNNPGALYSI